MDIVKEFGFDPVLSVLVAGHGESRLVANKIDCQDSLIGQLDRLITTAGDLSSNLFTDELYKKNSVEPSLRVITGTADGVDEWTAEITSNRGIPLQIMSPTLQKSLNESQRKAERNVSFGVTQQSAETDQSCYGERDRVALSFCDLLIVVWDGSSPRGWLGGTARLIEQAILATKPILWLNMQGELRLSDYSKLNKSKVIRLEGRSFKTEEVISCFSGRVSSDQWQDEIMALLNPFINPSTTVNKAHDSRLMDTYQCWKQATKLESAWVGPVEPEYGKAKHPIKSPGKLLEFFKRSDVAAVKNAGLHRSSVYVLYVLSAFAVFCSIAGIINLANVGGGWPVAEVLAILFILAFFGVSVKGKVHQRWISNRFIAEQLRYARMCYPALVVPRLFITNCWSFSGQSKPVLVNDELWLLQRAWISEGIPEFVESGNISRYKEILNQYVYSVVDDQKSYHVNNVKRYASFHKRLHVISTVFFISTFLAVVSHFVWHLDWLSLIAGFLPAAAASIHGILTKLEISRLEHQSHNTHTELEAINGALSLLGSADYEFMELREIIDRAASVMAEENYQWNNLINQQRAELPG